MKMAGEHEIVFEDLRGSQKDEIVQVDLDADSKGDGITRIPDDKSANDVPKKDDDIKFDSLRGAGDAPAKKPDDDDASRISEDDAYSKKVKARIQRATRGEKKAKQEASFWEIQARKLAKDGYESEKKISERTIAQADTAIEQAQADLEQAIEDGKSKDQVRLTTRLTDLKADRVRAEVNLDNLSPDGNVQPFSGKVASDRDSSDGNKADAWMSEQEDWYGARGFERQTRLANRLDKEVHADGFDPATDEYFEELNTRIKEKEPKLYDDGGADDLDDIDEHGEGDKNRGRKKVTKKSPVASVDGLGGNRRRTSGNKVELDEADFENMRRFNLDPNDPEVLKEYARNKLEAEAGEDR